MPIILVGIALWFWLGDPGKFVADIFYKGDAAPWETVDAFFYPDMQDLTRFQSVSSLKNVASCQDKVRAMASAAGDPGMMRTDYECGVGKLKGDQYGVPVYRLTVR